MAGRSAYNGVRSDLFLVILAAEFFVRPRARFGKTCNGMSERILIFFIFEKRTRTRGGERARRNPLSVAARRGSIFANNDRRHKSPRNDYVEKSSA